jgi:hypothetical protein
VRSPSRTFSPLLLSRNQAANRSQLEILRLPKIGRAKWECLQLRLIQNANENLETLIASTRSTPTGTARPSAKENLATSPMTFEATVRCKNELAASKNDDLHSDESAQQGVARPALSLAALAAVPPTEYTHPLT